MKSAVAITFPVALLLASSGCELLAGIDDRTSTIADPSDSGSATGGAGSGGAMGGECIGTEERCASGLHQRCFSGAWVDDPCPAEARICSGSACADVTGLALGHNHSCALLSNGRVACWGENIHGELGLGNGEPSLVPVEVPQLSGATGLTAGGDANGGHTCAIVEGGAVVCWGFNDDGQLGVGDKAPRYAPTPVGNLTGVKRLRAGHHASVCAVLADETVVCWGANESGQLGFQTGGADVLAPTVAPAVGEVDDISLGCNHACSSRGGVVRCWGANSKGQVGTGSFTPDVVSTPTEVALRAPASQIEMGCGFSCARLTDEVWCWGVNDRGHLGQGDFVNKASPEMTNVFASDAVSGGGWSACALVPGGAMCWGRNVDGSVGNGSLRDKDYPSPGSVQRLTAATLLETSWQHSCARQSDGILKCWGTNTYGQIGDGTEADRGEATAVSW